MRPLASADSPLRVLLFWSSEGACKVWVAKFGLVSNAFLSNTIHMSPWVTTGWQDHVPSCYVARWSRLRNPSVSWAPGQNYCTWLGWVGFTGCSLCKPGGEWVTGEDEQQGRTGFPLQKIWIYFHSFIASQNPFSSFLFFHAVTPLKSMVHLTFDFHLIPFKVI